MKVTDLVLILAALPLGVASAWSTDQWLNAADQGEAQVQQLKKDLLQSAGLFELHNEVFAQVGERAWEDRVKPQFLSAVTTATVRDTGNLLPDGRELIDWVRTHPDEARRLLRAAADLGKAPAP